MRHLKGRTAFITGGGSGIGLGIARALLKAGMNVVIADILEPHLEEASRSLGNPANLLPLTLDVTDRTAFAEAADAATRRFGNIHLLINNAGVALTGPIEQANHNDWEWVFGVNLVGVANGISTFLPAMLAHGEGGHIVNTASTSGLLPHAGAAIYSASKAAVIALSEALCAELAPKNIAVSVLCPGPVNSRIGESARTRPDSLAHSGYDTPLAPPVAEGIAHLFQSPDEIGERVRQGIENDALFILTHSEYRAGLQERSEALFRAIPDTAENPEFKAIFSSLIHNPAYQK